MVKKAVKKIVKKAVSVMEITRDEVVADRLKRPSMDSLREILQFQEVPACIDPFHELIAEAAVLHPSDRGNRHANELAKWQWCWSQLTEQAFSTSQELLSYKTFIEQCYEIEQTTGTSPCPCPPAIKILIERLQAITCALAYVEGKLSEEEVYNERNAECFVAADAWHDDYEKWLKDCDTVQSKHKVEIEKMVHGIKAIAQNSLCPPEVQTYAERLLAICDVSSHPPEEMLLKEMNLVRILDNLGWTELTRLRFEKKGISNPKNERVRNDARNMQNQIESLQKRLPGKEK